VRLQDGGMALGSLGNGVLVFDKNHQFIRAVNQKDNGFGNDVVYTITTDRDGAVWIGGANGVGRIDLAAEISFWNEGSGLKGTVYCIERHPVTGFLHVFTSSGAFYFEGTQIKEITELSTQQCWHAINFTNPDDPSDKRMLASYGNIAEIKDGKATDVLDGGISAVFKMYKDPTNPYKVWIGYGDALGSMRFEKGKWVNEGRIEGIDDDCRSMSLDKQTGDLWVGTFRKGVLRLIKKEAGGYEVKRYNAATGGVLSDKNVIIAEVADQRVFCTDKGLCVYNPATDKFEPWKELGEDYANGNRDVFSMQEDAQGNLWLSGLFVNTSPAMAAYRKPDGTYSLDGKPFKKVPPMMTLGLFTEADGTVWLGGSEGLFRYKPKEGAKREEANFHTLIRQVRIGQDSVSFWGNYYEEAEGKKIFSLVQHESTKHTFGADFNTVAFHFAAPFFDNEDQTVYQFYLEGFDEGWSPWEKVYQKEYTNLPGGEYVFRVKARNLYGNESTEASYRFKVLAPWYLRWYAILGYVVLLSALIYAIVRINAKRLKRENERLERLVEARTAEIRQKNTELLLQKEEIEAQAEVLQTANVQITEQKENLLQMNVELSQQKEEIMAQAENLRELNEEISVVNTDLSEKQLALEKAYDDIQTLSHIGQEITSILDLREIISTVYARVNQLMEASGFGVGVYNPETKCIEFNGFMEKGAPLPDHADDVHNDAFLSARVFKSQQPFFSNNTGHDFDDEHERLEIMEGDIPLSVMYMPLQFQGKPIGVITVQSFRKNAYSETDMSMLRSLASYASIAIANAQSYEVIKAKNRHITDSIRYSLTMQTAFLPSQKDLSKALGEYMLIYRPKDIVSGDFYWMEQPEENVMFLAVVDCTGHGVPGSFMSIIGSTILSEAVNMLGLRSPAAILEYLHQHVVKILSQEAHENDDGMDLALIRVERKGEEAVITFSGAKNDLLYVQQNTQALQIVSGDRKQIGGIQKAGKQFSDKVLQLKAGDSLFMLTDGIVDQNDGTTRKFGSLRMREILGKYAYLPKAELQQFIEDELRQFMGEAKQRDDITLLGFKL
jgi:serine phosphatase RsbU (regulator of sigma subunit)